MDPTPLTSQQSHQELKLVPTRNLLCSLKSFSAIRSDSSCLLISDTGQSLNKECGWNGGDRGGLAQWEQTYGKKK
jgi:hypothetical protein